MDRRALVVGSWLAQGRDKPSPQKVRSITERWNRIFAEDRYGFRSLEDRQAKPTPMHNPNMSDLTRLLENAQDVESGTELLFYFVGHSVSAGTDDIRLIVGLDGNGKDRLLPLKLLIDTIYAQTPIRSLVFVLDTCHVGRTQEAFRSMRENSFAMFATGDSYAFDANFSDGLLRALEQPIYKNDQRIDRRAGGVTYRKIFEEARRRLLSGSDAANRGQEPHCFGNYGGEVLLEAPVIVPDGFNAFASDRSIYGRVFRLLQIIKERSPTTRALRDAVRRDNIFLLRREEDGEGRYVSSQRISEYLDFLRTMRWLIQRAGHFELTPMGNVACNEMTFNKALLEAIEQHVFSDGIDFKFLDSMVKDLLFDMIPPTPARIKERAAMKGKVIELSPPTRVALQLLPSTGMFLKGAADAIFPSELGG